MEDAFLIRQNPSEVYSKTFQNIIVIFPIGSFDEKRLNLRLVVKVSDQTYWLVLSKASHVPGNASDKSDHEVKRNSEGGYQYLF